MKRLLLMLVPFATSFAVSAPTGEATAWRKSEKNPGLGSDLGTCFDVSVLRDGGKYRMWFSWRPKQSIALVESEDGLTWGEPTVVLGPDKASGWEDDVNRPVVLKDGIGYRMWYTGQAKGKSWIGCGTSEDGKARKR